MFQRIRSPNLVSTNSDSFYQHKAPVTNTQPPILKNSPSNQNYHSKYVPTSSLHLPPSQLQSQSDLRRIGSEKELEESHLK